MEKRKKMGVGEAPVRACSKAQGDKEGCSDGLVGLHTAQQRCQGCGPQKTADGLQKSLFKASENLAPEADESPRHPLPPSEGEKRAIMTANHGLAQEGIEKPNESIENNGFPRLGELVFPPLVPPVRGFDPAFS
ncbi:hypothetical protein EII18_10695 [Comamonadaceae bacterium OH3737_COT-264]|nr:hypothetical protein EII18_10695 [Comamonadaceae bacterium OH3737_COT-264]